MRAWMIVLMCLGCGAASCHQASSGVVSPPDQAVSGTVEQAPTPDVIAMGHLGGLTATTQDGQPQALELKRTAIKVQLVGRLARTEVTQVFHNHTDQRTEGTYAANLPEGAAISRLAMDVGGKMMEGELVERDKARNVYEGIVRRQKDPALLEWDGGNRFTTRIFPIEPGSDKTVIIAYEHLLPAPADPKEALQYVYALPDARSLGAVGDFEFVLTAEGAAAVADSTQYPVEVTADGRQAVMEARGFEPRGPLHVGIQLDNAKQPVVWQSAYKGEHFFMADVPVVPPETLRQRQPESLVLALDTSAGLGSVALAHAVATSQGLIQDWDGALALVHGDLKVRRCGSLEAISSQTAQNCLDGLDAGGATDLGALIEAACASAAALPEPRAVVLFSDGVPSVGQVDAQVLEAMAKQCGGKQTRLHTVAMGHAPNVDALKGLATAGAGHALRARQDQEPALTARALQRALPELLLRDVRVEVLGDDARDVLPGALSSLSPHGRLAVGGRWSGKGALRLRFHASYGLGGHVWDASLTPDAARDVPAARRFWARAMVEQMQATEAPRGELVAHSLKHGVMSPYTSFLVLESEEAYERFEIERRQAEEVAAENAPAGADVGGDVVAPDEVRTSDRDLSDLMKEEEALSQEAEVERLEELREEPRRLERMERRLERLDDGDGEGDVHRSELSPMRKEVEKLERRDPPMKKLVPNDVPRVSGYMDKTLIERVIKTNRNALRGCYETSLRKVPELNGTINVRFSIESDGSVGQTSIVKDTTFDAQLSACLLREIRTWKFPSPPGGGRIFVTYPFRFSNGEAAMSGAEAQIKALMGRLDELEDAQKARLLALMVHEREIGQARALLERWEKEAGPEAWPAQAVALLENPQVRESFTGLFVRAAVVMLNRPQPPENLYTDLWFHLVETDQGMKLFEQFSTMPPAADKADELMRSLENMPGTAGDLLAAWHQIEAVPVGTLAQWMLLGGALRWPMTDKFYAILDAAARTPEATAEVMEAYVAASVARSALAASASAVLARCHSVRVGELEPCRRWTGFYRMSNAELETVWKVLSESLLRDVRRRRATDFASVALITQQATIERELGRSEAAERLLSELVEFEPHNHSRRVQYAQALLERQMPEASCQQLTTAVQINPSQRDTFLRMTKIRRVHPELAGDLRECTVAAVSKLPVRRELSLILTWEDPEADIDLHIHEPGKSHVWYQSRQSKHQGLLYHDVTDGFGPEIYVIGDGPSGQYRITAVYYSGERPVRGTLTILRDAGSSNESRQEIPFELQSANDAYQLPLTTLTLP